METAVDFQKLQRAIDDTLSNFQKQYDANLLIVDLRTLLFSTIEDLIVSAMENRHRITLSENDHVNGRILFVCIDGGRLRERRAKKGRLATDQKRREYHADWREPTQIVIQWLDAEGNPIKDIAPIYDATMSEINNAFELLEDYLRQIGVAKADGVIFCADGDRRDWEI